MLTFNFSYLATSEFETPPLLKYSDVIYGWTLSDLRWAMVQTFYLSFHSLIQFPLELKNVYQKRLATVQRNAYLFGASPGLKLQKFSVFFACVPRCTRSLCTKVMRVRSVTIISFKRSYKITHSP